MFNEKFVQLSRNELQEIDGGFAWMIVVATGVACGFAAAKVASIVYKKRS